MRNKRKVEVERLQQILVGQSGLTIHQIARRMKVKVKVARQRVQDLRRFFGHEQTIAAESQGKSKPWLYFLTNLPDQARWWVNNRLRDMEARLVTQRCVAQTLERATDARTIEGKKARKIARTLEYLEKELADIDS